MAPGPAGRARRGRPYPVIAPGSPRPRRRPAALPWRTPRARARDRGGERGHARQPHRPGRRPPSGQRGWGSPRRAGPAADASRLPAPAAALGPSPLPQQQPRSSTPTALLLRGAGPPGRWSAEPSGGCWGPRRGNYDSHNAPPARPLGFTLPRSLARPLEPQPRRTDSRNSRGRRLCCALRKRRSDCNHRPARGSRCVPASAERGEGRKGRQLPAKLAACEARPVDGDARWMLAWAFEEIPTPVPKPRAGGAEPPSPIQPPPSVGLGFPEYCIPERVLE